MKRLSVFVVLILALCGCQSIRVDRNGDLDMSEKTMTVPAGYGRLSGDLKRALKSDGWQLYAIAKGKDVSIKEDNRVETEWSTKARYRLLINCRQVDVDILFRPLYDFEVSILDNRSGEELIAISGNNALGEEVVAELRKQMVK